MPSYTVVRATRVDAAPERVHALVDDFRQWRGRSPWEEIDPALERSYAADASPADLPGDGAQR
ncbi:MAG: hypothetical protein ACRCYQ_07540 [Nocardioides sp.]